MTEQHSLINIFNRIKNILIILNENIKSKQLEDINPLLNPELKDDYTVGELLQKPWIQIVDRIFKLQTVLLMYNTALPKLLEKIQGKIDSIIQIMAQENQLFEQQKQQISVDTQNKTCELKEQCEKQLAEAREQFMKDAIAKTDSEAENRNRQNYNEILDDVDKLQDQLLTFNEYESLHYLHVYYQGFQQVERLGSPEVFNSDKVLVRVQQTGSKNVTCLRVFYKGKKDLPCKGMNYVLNLQLSNEVKKNEKFKLDKVDIEFDLEKLPVKNSAELVDKYLGLAASAVIITVPVDDMISPFVSSQMFSDAHKVQVLMYSDRLVTLLVLNKSTELQVYPDSPQQQVQLKYKQFPRVDKNSFNVALDGIEIKDPKNTRITKI